MIEELFLFILKSVIILQLKSLYFWKKTFKHKGTKKSLKAQRKTKTMLLFLSL